LTLPVPVDGFAKAIAVVFTDAGPTVTSIEALLTKIDGATVACAASPLVLLIRVSVASNPAMLPETSVIIANPVRVVVFWAKAAGRLPQSNIARKPRMVERMIHL
jgi:type IV secretory pathway protease TraF